MVSQLKIYYWLLLTISYIHSLDRGEAVCAAFLDLHKAFDSLDHYILLWWLYEMILVQQYYIGSRTTLMGEHIVRVKRVYQFLSWRYMKGGLPQGSAVGPLMFSVYMNTLPLQITEGLLLQYTDDTAFVCSGSTPTAASMAMNTQLTLIHQWIIASQMRLNYSKSTVMCLSYQIISKLLVTRS